MLSDRGSPAHIRALDGLRAIAIILVLLRHTFRPFSDAWAEHFQVGSYNILTFFINGWVGVDLFFVLSGFLITLTFVGYKDNLKSIKTYILKRVLRIVPAYYAVLIICSAVIFFAGTMENEELLWSFAYHLLFLQDYLPSNINVVFWSLGVEEKFYMAALLLLPFIFRIHTRYQTTGVAAVVALLILLGIALRVWGYYSAYSPDDYDTFFRVARSPFHACFAPLLIGVLTAVIYKNRDQSSRDLDIKKAQSIFYISGCAFIILLASHAMMDKITLYDALFQPLLIAIIMGGLVFGAVFGGGFKWLEAKPLRHISVLSYSLYLVHLPLWPLCKYLIDAIPALQSNPYGYIIVFFLFYMLMSYIFAYALHLLVEKPFLKLKSKL